MILQFALQYTVYVNFMELHEPLDVESQEYFLVQGAVVVQGNPDEKGISFTDELLMPGEEAEFMAYEGDELVASFVFELPEEDEEIVMIDLIEELLGRPRSAHKKATKKAKREGGVGKSAGTKTSGMNGRTTPGPPRNPMQKMKDPKDPKNTQKDPSSSSTREKPQGQPTSPQKPQSPQQKDSQSGGGGGKKDDKDDKEEEGEEGENGPKKPGKKGKGGKGAGGGLFGGLFANLFKNVPAFQQSRNKLKPQQPQAEVPKEDEKPQVEEPTKEEPKKEEPAPMPPVVHISEETSEAPKVSFKLVDDTSKLPVTSEVVTFRMANGAVSKAKTDARGAIRFTNEALKVDETLEIEVRGKVIKVKLDEGANVVSHMLVK